MAPSAHEPGVFNPWALLLGWLVSVTVRLVVFLGRYQIVPGQKKTIIEVWIVVMLLTQTTIALINRFSDEKRQADPIAVSQEHGIRVLAILT